MSQSPEAMMQQAARDSIPAKILRLENLAAEKRQDLSLRVRAQLSESAQANTALKQALHCLAEQPTELPVSLKALQATELQQLDQILEALWPEPQNGAQWESEEESPSIQSVSKLELQTLDFGESESEVFALLDLEEASAESTPTEPTGPDSEALWLFYQILAAHYFLNHVAA